MEHPICTPDERDMASGSSVLHADQLDRFREAIRPVRTAQSGLGVGF